MKKSSIIFNMYKQLKVNKRIIMLGLVISIVSAPLCIFAQNTTDESNNGPNKIFEKAISQDIVIIPMLINYATLATVIAARVQNNIEDMGLAGVEVRKTLGLDLREEELPTVLDEYFIDAGYNTIIFVGLKNSGALTNVEQDTIDITLDTAEDFQKEFDIVIMIYRKGNRTPTNYFTMTALLAEIKNDSLEDRKQSGFLENLALVSDTIAESQDKVLYSIIHINPSKTTRPEYVLKASDENLMFASSEIGEAYVPTGHQAIEIYQIIEDEQQIIGAFEINFTDQNYIVNIPFVDTEDKKGIEDKKRKAKSSFLDYPNSIDVGIAYQYPIYSSQINVFFPTIMYNASFKYSIQKFLLPLYLGITVNFAKFTPADSSNFDVFQTGVFLTAGSVFIVAKNTEINLGLSGGIIFMSQTNLTQDVLHAQATIPSLRADLGLTYHIPIRRAGSIRLFINTDIISAFTETYEAVSVVEARDGVTSTNKITVIHLLGSASLGMGWRF